MIFFKFYHSFLKFDLNRWKKSWFFSNHDFFQIFIIQFFNFDLFLNVQEFKITQKIKIFFSLSTLYKHIYVKNHYCWKHRNSQNNDSSIRGSIWAHLRRFAWSSLTFVQKIVFMRPVCGTSWNNVSNLNLWLS